VGLSDALPLSEFRLERTWRVRAASEALMSFEGSGIDSFWTLELPQWRTLAASITCWTFC